MTCVRFLRAAIAPRQMTSTAVSAATVVNGEGVWQGWGTCEREWSSPANAPRSQQCGESGHRPLDHSFLRADAGRGPLALCKRTVTWTRYGSSRIRQSCRLSYGSEIGDLIADVTRQVCRTQVRRHWVALELLRDRIAKIACSDVRNPVIRVQHRATECPSSVNSRFELVPS